VTLHARKSRSRRGVMIRVDTLPAGARQHQPHQRC
jgi:hypothetical protein